MKATLCDFCGEKMDEDSDTSHKIMIDGEEFDCCNTCYNSTVILAEHRRSKTLKVRKQRNRKPKAEPTMVNV